MTHRPLPRPAKFLVTYLSVLAVMLAWWLALRASTETAAPVLTLLVAYAVPVAAWAGLVILGTNLRGRHER